VGSPGGEPRSGDLHGSRRAEGKRFVSTAGAHRPNDGRDRDAAGRPRNARPRDALGRPLPHGAVGVEGIPDDLALSPEDTLIEAQRLLDAGRTFQAHEVLESTWKSAPEAERELWRGLAQLAVGLTHVWRGNEVGALELLRRSADRLQAYAGTRPHGVDTVALVAWTHALVVRIERDGLAAVTRTNLTPRLRPR
jgi:hypothetical protein